MRLRNTVLILLACISFSFSTFASEYDSLFEEYGIENAKDLEDALSMYYEIKEYAPDDFNLFDSISMYWTAKDYGISDSDELEDALYSYFYFDDATNEERLSDTQKKVLEEIESDNYSYGYYDGLYRGRMDVFTWIFFIAFILFIMYVSGFLEHFR